jgi:hypothetical protein
MSQPLCIPTRGRRSCPRMNQNYHASAQLARSSPSVRHRQRLRPDRKTLIHDFRFHYLHSLHNLKACTRIDSLHQQRTTPIIDSAHHGRANSHPPHRFSNLIQTVRLLTFTPLPTIKPRIVHHSHPITRDLPLSAAILTTHMPPETAAVASPPCTTITTRCPPHEHPTRVPTAVTSLTSASAKHTAVRCTATSHVTLSPQAKALRSPTSMDPTSVQQAGRVCPGSPSSCRATSTISMARPASGVTFLSSPPRS